VTRRDRSARAADRIARALVGLYPRRLRQAFGEEMLELLRAKLLASRARGVAGRWRFWTTTGTDLARSRWQGRSSDGASLTPSRSSSGLGSDVRDAVRVLRRSPALTAAIVALLALSLGATTLVFSVVNAVVLRALPFGEPDRLVMVWEARPDRQLNRNVVAGHEFPEWAARNQSFERMAAMALSGSVALTGTGDPASLTVVRVTAGFGDVMRVRPLVGRMFRDDEDVPGHGQVVLLSERLWRERFGANPDVLGRSVILDGQPFEVVGVMPSSFAFPPVLAAKTPDAWVPIAEPIHLYRGRHYLYVVARLKPGVSVAAAETDMAHVAASLATELGDLNRGHEARVVPLHDDLIRDARQSLWLVMGAVGCLLLIGCGNVASLLLARGRARHREISLRLALGATAGRVARQLLLESLVLAAAGGLVGVAATFWLARLLPRLVPPEALALDAVPVDLTVLLVALAVSVLTGLLFGTAPALQAQRVSLTGALKRGGPTLSGGHTARLRGVLVTTQIALTLLLACAAGVMIRGVAALQRIDPGFRADGLLAADVFLPGSRYGQASQQRRFFDEALARLRTLPGVKSAALTSAVPLGGAVSTIAVAVEGRPAPKPGEDDSAHYRVVSTDYFKTMGVPVRLGRDFADSDARVALPLIRWYPQQPKPDGFDAPQAAPVAIINEAMARRFWPADRPLGRRIHVLFSPSIEIIGVVADARNDSLRDAAVPEFYLLDTQEPQSGASMLVRTNGHPSDAAPDVRAAIWSVDKDVPIASMRTMDSIVAGTFSLSRFTSTLVGTFAAVALLLMVAGVYGLIAFTTSERLPEIGVRLALGADRAQILRMVVRDGVTLAVAGVTLGAASSVLLNRLLHGEIFGIGSIDLATGAAAIGFVFAAVAAAAWWPARRASFTDPISVLRQE
jgi:putative ABC transport system permease protein